MEEGTIYRVTKRIDFCYGHRLPEYYGKCQHPHGHNGRVEVVLEAPDLDEQGMVADFSTVKGDIKGWIDANLDHQMILRGDDPLVGFLKEHGEPHFLLDEPPTAEAIAKRIFLAVKQMGYGVVEVRLWETPTSVAAYRD